MALRKNETKKQEHEEESDPSADYVFTGDVTQEEVAQLPEIVLPEEPTESIVDIPPEVPDGYDDRISVGRALREHYDLIILHRNAVLDDELSENKDRASAISVTTSVIKELEKIQTSLYNAETFAVFQSVVISVLNECDEGLKNKVVDELEKRLARL